MAKVELTDEAREDLKELDGSARKQAAKALKKLECEFELRGQPLGSRGSGNLTTFRKLVVGNRDYRIIFRVEPDGTIVVVWVIASRTDDECYELALSRLQLHSDRARAEAAADLVARVWNRAPQDRSQTNPVE
ncbi:type II toxin-antitoxin system RelE/ParE family toxin [Saccharopolyspora sp. TS4A08]|uniref:Type II toxin-antitoxin system RelE/ParE family toxin n=1 Tax=Saccharopolyspora ipomoeae TaxID=3042027 RepID=A0ABT6PJ25_9PSEU|nr:type II toxin-antitoxin system RelE/ParE family toxin [Saccharopolyspora sp. TS4A08]MDI2027476.1 type II toxin-antitoxin system RelE/ParE family toxin [Saccharopolyspora sp. TS4A08]